MLVSRPSMRYLDLAVILAYLIGHHLVRRPLPHAARKACGITFSAAGPPPGGPSASPSCRPKPVPSRSLAPPPWPSPATSGFLQLVLGYLLARIVISVLFLPQYFRGEMFTAYELMRRRFGERIRKLTASIFLVTRALAEGVRVFAISLVISIVLGTGEIAVDCADCSAHPVLHIRRRHDRGDLDRRRADEPLRGGRGGQLLRHPRPDSGGLASRGGGGRRRRQIHDLRFSLFADHGVLLPHLHLLGRHAWAAAF